MAQKTIKKSANASSLHDNNLYNLMTQLVQEQKSLWRIKDEYMKDAGKDKDLKAFWAEVAAEKELLIEDLQAIIKMELQ